MRPLRRTLTFWLRGLAVLVACLSGAGALAAPAAVVTIVEGDALLIDGGRSLVAAEGLKLAEGTLVRTGAGSRLLRVEWPDGTAADFGPDTQAMVGPPAMPGRGKAPAVYLLKGWLKLSGVGAAGSPGATMPRVELLAHKGAVVAMVSADETWVFAEAGTAPLQERELKPTSAPTLKAGEVYLRQGAAKGTVAGRPSPTQMQRVPRGFRDSLPLRIATFKDRSVTPRPAAAPSYADLSDWLTAEAALRKPFTRRFAERARDAGFRSGLVANLTRHPEWEPVLFPERFTKPASAPR